MVCLGRIPKEEFKSTFLFSSFSRRKPLSIVPKDEHWKILEIEHDGIDTILYGVKVTECKS